MSFENGIIDLRSDTVTQPTEAMRRAMAAAEVGDDVYDEDPTINNLHVYAAEITGKEASLFVPSGTMGNLIAVLVHCGRGDEAMMGDASHTYLNEAGGLSALGGVFPNIIPNQPDGTLRLEDIRRAVREEDIHHPISKLLILENTQNVCGGAVLGSQYIHEAQTLAHDAGMKCHMDGARIFNAAVAMNTKAELLLSTSDSVMFCLSKGLCAPVGSMLCGSMEFIQSAKRLRKQLGGGMRQAGILAAAGLIAVKDMRERLGEDHLRAKTLAEGLAQIPGIEMDKGLPQTNMVFIRINDSHAKSLNKIKEEMAKEGILIGQSDPQHFRLVTHYWINDTDIFKTIQAMNRVLSE